MKNALILFIFSFVVWHCQPHADKPSTPENGKVHNYMIPNTINDSTLLAFHKDVMRYAGPKKELARRYRVLYDRCTENTHWMTKAYILLQSARWQPDNQETLERLLYFADTLQLKKNRKMIAKATYEVISKQQIDELPLLEKAKRNIASDQPDVTIVIRDIEKHITAAFTDSLALDKRIAEDYVYTVQLFSAFYPDNSDKEEYLKRAAGVARYESYYVLAHGLYDWIYRDNPKSKAAGTAMFLKAFMYDESMKDKESARHYYSQFVDLFPNHSLKSQAENLIRQLDLSEEELLDYLQSQAEENLKQ